MVFLYSFSRHPNKTKIILANFILHLSKQIAANHAMYKLITFLLLLCVLVLLHPSLTNSEVFDLTTNNFDEFIKNQTRPTYVIFYSPCNILHIF